MKKLIAVLVSAVMLCSVMLPALAESQKDETLDSWYGSRLEKIDPTTQFICFLVRPDSYKIFQRARNMAWIKNINVACELQDEKNPIMIGPGGERMFMQ